MSLRAKLVAALVLLATAATVSIGVFSYSATADRLDAEVDRSLEVAIAEAQTRIVDNRAFPGIPRGLRNGPANTDVTALPNGGPRTPVFELVLVQILDASGAVSTAPESLTLPVDNADRVMSVSHDRSLRETRDVTVNGEPYRMITAPIGTGTGAVQVARSLTENERLLDSLRNRTLVAVVLVIALAALLGWLVAYEVTRRLVRLTATAEEVAATGRLDVDVPVRGRDEAGRLGAAFDEMLTALARSKEDQQRLVQDAGHELRTPLTSLRTNVSVLRRYDQLPPDARARLLDDLDGETRELTDLLNELVELASERRGEEPVQRVVLGDIAEHVAVRTGRRTGRTITVLADASTVDGRPQALERAIGNLVDNAAKFDVTGTEPIEVVVQHGRVEVRDRGPGLDPADIPHLFDRFYRAVGARSRPGSGLGLAIVKAVAEVHGGTVFAADRPGGGSVIGFELPTVPAATPT